MTFRVCVILTLMMTGGAVAQDNATKTDKQPAAGKQTAPVNEAIAILKKVDEATKAVKAVKYSAKLEVTGWIANRFGSAEGTAILAKGSEDTLDRFLFKTKITPPGKDAEAKEYTVGSNGDVFFIVDHANKKVHADMDPAVMGSAGQRATVINMREFTHPTPFSDEINGDKQVLKGIASVNGEDCYEIHVVYRGGQQQAHWFFSKNDYLPRRVERIIKNAADESGKQILTLSGLVANPELDDETFATVVPEGYEKTDEFMPNERPRL